MAPDGSPVGEHISNVILYNHLLSRFCGSSSPCDFNSPKTPRKVTYYHFFHPFLYSKKHFIPIFLCFRCQTRNDYNLFLNWLIYFRLQCLQMFQKHSRNKSLFMNLFLQIFSLTLWLHSLFKDSIFTSIEMLLFFVFTFCFYIYI